MTRKTISGLIVAATLSGLLTVSLPGSETPQSEFFEMRVRPLLAKNCHACHTNSRLGGLRLDSREALLQGGNSGPAVVPGDPEKSLLIQAVTHMHSRLKMPMNGEKLKDSEIADLAAWIRSGAAWNESPSSNVAGANGSEYKITTEQRSFWAFRPVQRPAIPAVRDSGWVRSPIDSFILRELEQRGMKPARPADKRSLVRRAYFDLIGLPPTPEEVDAFIQDTSPNAFATVVDRLLASPRYGERWGRYWLDVARYSDDKLDPTGEMPYENSYRYRDWVIRAFNEDMPYNLFVKAQLAGDLMESSDAETYGPGLGLFGLSPQFQDDRVDVTTRGFLGLTVACAQCHDHKFDPIPTKDFYSLLGVFRSTESYEFPLADSRTVSVWEELKKKVEAQEKAIKEFIAEMGDQLCQIFAARLKDYMMAADKALESPKSDSQAIADAEKLDRETLDRWINYLKRPDKDHPYLKKWSEIRKSNTKSEELQKAAAEFQEKSFEVFREKRVVDLKNEVTLGGKKEIGKDNGILANAVLLSLERDHYILWRDLFGDNGLFRYGNRRIDRFLSGDWKNHLDALRAELARLKEARGPQYPFLHAIRDVKNPHNIRVALRGNPETPGDEVPRHSLSILSDGPPKPFVKGSGRLELAEALSDPQNPLTARVMVNRIWQHHFGQGIVRTPSNFGHLGERPTHPELVDYLASRFVEKNWSIKAMHREIMLASVYLQSAEWSERNFKLDPENRLLWRANAGRLDAEAMRDSLLFVSGTLDLVPTVVGGLASPMVDDNRRRTVYCFISRKKLDGMLSLFDFANPNNTSEARIATNVPLQRLYFMNSGFVTLQAKALADRLKKEFGAADERKIMGAYRILYGRAATKTELKLGLDFLDGKSGEWWKYAQVLLSSNEFLFVN